MAKVKLHYDPYMYDRLRDKYSRMYGNGDELAKEWRAEERQLNRAGYFSNRRDAAIFYRQELSNVEGEINFHLKNARLFRDRGDARSSGESIQSLRKAWRERDFFREQINRPSILRSARSMANKDLKKARRDLKAAEKSGNESLIYLHSNSIRRFEKELSYFNRKISQGKTVGSAGG